MTTAQILIGFGLIILLAVGSQVLADMSHGAAVVLGIILVVSGPTVVGALLVSSGRPNGCSTS